MAYSRISGWGEWGGVIINEFCTRFHVGYLIILAIFGVDISRDVDSALIKALFYLVFGPYKLQLHHQRAAVIAYQV